jgi:hypothetical protein
MKTRLSLTLLLFSLHCSIPSHAQEPTDGGECSDCPKVSTAVKQSDVAAIDRMLARMNSTAGEEKREAIVALLNLLVQERQSMRAEIAALRTTATQSSGCQKCCDCCKETAPEESQGKKKKKEEKRAPAK